MVGGGRIATRKVESLLKAGVKVTVISPEITEAIRKWGDQSKLRHLQRSYQKGDIKGYLLAYAATGLPEVDEEMAAEARSEGALLNVVDPSYAMRLYHARHSSARGSYNSDFDGREKPGLCQDGKAAFRELRGARIWGCPGSCRGRTQ